MSGTLRKSCLIRSALQSENTNKASKNRFQISHERLRTMDNDALLPSDNRLIATAVRTSLAGQTILSLSKGTFYKAVGVGAFLSLLGIGTGLAFYGYSRVSGASTNLETITSAIRRSIQSTKLNVVSTGQVALTNAQVAVKDGQSVSLEPGAKVAVIQKKQFTVAG